jgi:acarbose 7IV-phosphotransferase
MARDKVLVCGNANVETGVELRRGEAWPLRYEPSARSDGLISTTVGGVGFNVASALTKLGHEVRFASIIGRDPLGQMVLEELRQRGINGEFVSCQTRDTAQAVVIYDTAKRQTRTDLKNLSNEAYPPALFARVLDEVVFAVMTNVYYSKPLLDVVVASGIRFVTDLHNISEVHNAYNEPFMRKASALFMSNESLPNPNEPAAWIKELYAEYRTPILIVGMGSRGAMISVDGNRPVYFPAVKMRPAVNSVGAGDALCSAFVHCLLSQGERLDPYSALKKAMLFASWKVGESGGSVGFLTSDRLDALAGRFEQANAGFGRRSHRPLASILRPEPIADVGKTGISQAGRPKRTST